MENQNNIQISDKKILIVEDEDSLRLALSNKLEKNGYFVSQAKDGVEGLNMALVNQPDLILLDIAMPRMDGFSMLDKLRENNWGKKVKVIILTNFDADDEKMSKVIKDQPSYYLVKNNNTLEQIIEKVQELLSQPKEGELV